MTDLRLLLLDETSPDIIGSRAEGLTYLINGKPYLAIIQQKDGEGWIDLDVPTEIRWSEDNCLFHFYNGKPCLRFA